MAIPKNPTPSGDQASAWGFYGMPATAAAVHGTKSVTRQAVGEVRYVVGWMADQMVRMGWRVMVDGSESWQIRVNKDLLIVSDSDEDDAENPRHPANASRELLSAVGWCDEAVRQVTTNLFVAGELYYLYEKEKWSVASIIAPNLGKRIKEAALKVRGLWPHPADLDAPDAPLFGVLAVLEDLLWLTRLERSQSANRVGMRGILLVADQIAPAGKDADSERFWDDLAASLSRPMDSPDDLAPLTLRGPAEIIKAEGGGAAGMTWVIPDLPYDDKVGDREKELIQRLAYGLPVPPEILLGMQAQSRATAFQVEGNAYRAHIEPAAWLVAQVPEDALRLLLPDEIGNLRVVPDPTAILARRHSVQDVLEAFDRGAVGFDYLREALGIPSRAEPDEDDIALRQRLGISTRGRQVADAADGAADEPVTAAASLPVDELLTDAPDETADDRYLSEQLARIDTALLDELIGAAEQAVVKARERLGAAVRSKSTNRDAIPADLANDEIALKIGEAALGQLGVDVPRVVENALAAIRIWWQRRLARAQGDITALLAEGDVPVDFDQALAAESVELLGAVLTENVFAPAVNVARLREVIALAGS